MPIINGKVIKRLAQNTKVLQSTDAMDNGDGTLTTTKTFLVTEVSTVNVGQVKAQAQAQIDDVDNLVATASPTLEINQIKQ